MLYAFYLLITYDTSKISYVQMIKNFLYILSKGPINTQYSFTLLFDELKG